MQSVATVTGGLALRAIHDAEHTLFNGCFADDVNFGLSAHHRVDEPQQLAYSALFAAARYVIFDCQLSASFRVRQS